MKKTIFMLAMLALPALGAKAQGDCVIPIMVLVPEQVDALAPMAHAKLESKMRQIVTANGMEGTEAFANFCLVANATEGSKEVTAGLRPLVTVTTDLELIVGNNFTGEKFASTVVTLNGAGRNASKAYTSAFGGINAGNPQLRQFLRDAKQKVTQYYETQIPGILSKAKSLAVRRNYEEALCLLTSVPTCCGRYDEVEQCMVDIFQQYVDYDCATKVSKARAIWNAGQDRDAARLAGAYLASIDPASSCREEALQLAEAIRARIGDDWEFYKELRRDDVMLEQARIEAIRAIGVAYGKNQKPTTISEHWIVR